MCIILFTGVLLTATSIATPDREDERLLTRVRVSPLRLREEDGPRGFSYQLRSRSTRGAANIHYAAGAVFRNARVARFMDRVPLEASSPSAGQDYRDEASPRSCLRERRGERGCAERYAYWYELHRRVHPGTVFQVYRAIIDEWVRGFLCIYFFLPEV